MPGNRSQKERVALALTGRGTGLDSASPELILDVLSASDEAEVYCILRQHLPSKAHALDALARVCKAAGVHHSTEA
jgi:hypothetical protein